MPRVNYANGKIYKIIPTCEFEEGDIYIGCTAGTLKSRLLGHKNPKQKCSSKILFEKYGIENCTIELIEAYPCGLRQQLERREGEIQRSMKCINKNFSNGKKDILNPWEYCEIYRKKDQVRQEREERYNRHKEYYDKLGRRG